MPVRPTSAAVPSRGSRGLVLAAVAVSALVAPGPARAADWEVVPFLGYRTGGSVQRIDTGSTAAFDGSGIVGVTVERAVRPEAWLGGTWSHQSTSVGGGLLDLDLDYLQFDGAYEPHRERRSGAYVLVSAGVCRLRPSSGASEWLLAGSIGGGGRFALGSRLSLKLEARGWAALTEAGAAAFCSGGCSFAFSGSGLFQLDVSAGLAIPF